MGKVKKKPKATKPAEFAEVLTLAEAAAYLRVGADGLDADARAGRVPGRLVGGEWRFHRDGLAVWLTATAGVPGDTPAEAALRRHMTAMSSGDPDAECDTFLEYLREKRAEDTGFVERGQEAG